MLTAYLTRWQIVCVRWEAATSQIQKTVHHIFMLTLWLLLTHFTNSVCRHFNQFPRFLKSQPLTPDTVIIEHCLFVQFTLKPFWGSHASQWQDVSLLQQHLMCIPIYILQQTQLCLLGSSSLKTRLDLHRLKHCVTQWYKLHSGTPSRLKKSNILKYMARELPSNDRQSEKCCVQSMMDNLQV